MANYRPHLTGIHPGEQSTALVLIPAVGGDNCGHTINSKGLRLTVGLLHQESQVPNVLAPADDYRDNERNQA